MPESRYIRVFVDGQELDLPEETLPLSINYKLEAPDDFQKKKSSDALGLEFPATTNNDVIGNAFHDPASVDLTPDKIFSNFRRGVIEANGFELLVGKAFAKAATHNDKPLSYRYDFYGNNADWKIELEELTLYDVLKHINFTFDKPTIEASWAFDGTNENLPYVFAPVRYRDAMLSADTDMGVNYMRPSLSLFWPLYWGFKKAGYKIKGGGFLDTPFFRRTVMPWTWGNFLFSEGTQLDELDFLAKSTQQFTRSGISRSEYIDAFVSNDSTDGAFDNNNSYQYDVANLAMKWTYLPAFSFGTIEAGFYINIFLEAQVNANSDMHLWVRWFKNGTMIADTSLKSLDAPGGILNKRSFTGTVEDWQLISVDPSDIITAKLFLRTFDSSLGRATVKLTVDEFSIQYFRIPVGGEINFANFPAFKKYKWLDYLRGIIDLYNLEIQTDPINKIVLIEPQHPYSVAANQGTKLPGYFNQDYIDWEDKQDVSKVSEVQLFSEHERELVLNFRDDSNDGALKVIQDRNQNDPGASKFVLPSRFKGGRKSVTNRFFSPLVHYDVEQWSSITGIAPQMPVIVPENISNTSRDEAQNTFLPKVAWYKGNITGVGGWKFDGVELTSFPFMFSVNYKEGGQNDPVLSYSDERIGNGPGAVRAVGLLRRFYLQRMAIMRNGQHYFTHFYLNNTDVSNWFHREHKKCRGQRWELIEVNDYRPLEEKSTAVTLRRWVPISQEDVDNCFPSGSSILIDSSTNQFDLKYSPLKCLPSDIPNT